MQVAYHLPWDVGKLFGPIGFVYGIQHHQTPVIPYERERIQNVAQMQIHARPRENGRPSKRRCVVDDASLTPGFRPSMGVWVGKEGRKMEVTAGSAANIV